MSELRQELLRASERIRAQLVVPDSRVVSVDLPDCFWGECVRLANQMEQLSRRGWRAAAQDRRQRLMTELRDLQSSLQEVLREIEAPANSFMASQREIFEDLLALEKEFDGLDVDLKEKEIAVATDPIRLEGVYLGAFRIILRWSELCTNSPYRVEATDSDYAASGRSDTPHPHVDGELLCEGDATLPIREALKQGRLFDFFTIVRQTLQTYNAASAYVRLSDWNGVKCSDCDDTVDVDDRYGCERCGSSICSECYRCCAACDCYLCGECTDTCPTCDDYLCKTCLVPCRDCDTHFCQECLTDGQCDDCRETDDEPEQPESETAVPEAAEKTGAAVHPHRVRQAVVPARRRRH